MATLVLPTVSPDYRMSASLQVETLAICLVVVALIIAGLWSVVTDVRDRWSIEDALHGLDDFTDDFCIGRDLHLEGIRDAMRAARSDS